MRVAAFLDALRRLPVTTPERLTGNRPFVVLSPHPDDDALGTGGLIAAACGAGQRVVVVTLTDGSGSHPRSILFPRDKLVALRKAESESAADRLGLPVDHLRFLGLPDAAAPSAGPAFERAMEAILAVVREVDAASIFVTWGRDPHCDHEAADRMARALRSRDPTLQLWSYPIWGWHLDGAAEVDEPAPVGWRVDISPWLEAKRDAVAAHASQMTALVPDDPQGFRFTAETIAPFHGPFEYFFEVPA